MQFDTLELLEPQIEGRLLPRYFLDTVIRDTPEWASVPDAALDALVERLRPLFAGIADASDPNEAETESTLIFPIIEAIGWSFLPQQAANSRREDRPDALLFRDASTRDSARRHAAGTPARMRNATIVQENKAWGVRLDSASATTLVRTPASQMLRYLRLAEEASEGAVRWGLLTNGRLWRLYFAGAGSRAEQYLEADLEAFVDASDTRVRRDLLRSFLLFFRPQAHRPEGDAPMSFLDTALATARRYETQITTALSKRVFDTIFPELVAAIAEGDRLALPGDAAWREQVREAALVLLYRCLFVLYAEDRRLLPVDHIGYRDYAFRKLRNDAARVADGTDTLNPRGTIWWSRMQTLFRAIAEGAPELGLPPYNGGLFDDKAHPLLARVVLRDDAMASLIEAVSREGPAMARHWINFRDLSVQHLGAIYEALLEREVSPDPSARGGVTIRPNAHARKTTGSYYTPDILVQLVIRRAVAPLLKDRIDAFRARSEELSSVRGLKAEKLMRLAEKDAAESFLSLRVCDPAMGSGHFLVSLVDFLADATLEAMVEATEAVTWGDYVSPLSVTLAKMRQTIRDRAAAGGWTVPEQRIDDKSLVRRIILKRVVHGVDINPMAVELAKLSLWLHSFTVGAPLSFLDHHLRCGDALFGEFVGPLVTSRTATLAVVPSVLAARNAAHAMARIEEIADADIAEVHESQTTYEAVQEATAPVRRFLDVVQAARWLNPPKGDPEHDAYRDLLLGGLGDPVRVACGEEKPTGPSANAVASLLAHAHALADERRFLHWELAFPNVWDRWESTEPEGGFDAVIGNPPWDKVEIDDNKWFRTHAPEFVGRDKVSKKEITAAIARHKKQDSDLWHRYLSVRDRMHNAVRVARADGLYPKTSAGRADLFALFAERGLRLLHRYGRLGLLVPTGLVADKRTAGFFADLAEAERVDAILDFENRLGPLAEPEKDDSKPRPAKRKKVRRTDFFPDVDSRSKFCVFAAVAPGLKAATIDCAFFLAAEEANVPPERIMRLSAPDFSAVNPNTRTAAMFRSARAAELVIALHKRHPILERTRGAHKKSVWPVGYSQMFNMNTDRKEGRLRTREELEAEGWYSVSTTTLRRGNEHAMPLFVGRMVHQFDHRYAAVTESEEAEENDSVGVATNPLQHADPSFFPQPRYFVKAADIPLPEGLAWFLAYRDITNATNARTSIAAIIPRAGAGHTLPIIPPDLPAPLPPNARPGQIAERDQKIRDALSEYAKWAPLLLANMNALPFDFVTRQKVQSTHLSFYILQQMPVISVRDYATKFGQISASDLIRDHVLRLTYTAHDLAPFARDQGYTGAPFRWDEEERLHLRARLDAAYCLLYGLARPGAEYALSTFPIVEREERARFGGRFRSSALILGYMAAFSAGDVDSRIVA